MKKQQTVWLLVRTAGVYFAFSATLVLAPLAASVPDLFTLPKLDRKAGNSIPFDPSKPMPGIGETVPTAEGAKEKAEAERAFRAQSLENFLWFLSEFLFYALLAWYFIRDGRVIFDVLNREEPFELARTEEAVTALNLSEAPGETTESGEEKKIKS